MNYTGRPSISGCRPVLSLYPTHRFCQYLLLIFITFTNSFLFNRAFSTNSRRALRRAAGVTALPEGEELNLSVIASQCHCPGCGSQRLLRCRSHPAGRGPNSSSLFPPLAAVVAVAPTEGRLWHSGKLLLFARGSPTRGASGETVHFAGTAKASPTRRGGIASAMTERLYEGEPDLFHAKRPLHFCSGLFSENQAG